LYTFNLVENNIIRIFFPYCKESVETVRTFSERIWNPELVCWEIPLRICNEIPEILGVQIPQVIKEKYEHIYVLKPVKFNSSLLRPEIKLYPFQISGIEFLSSNKNSLLSDDVGLGKTPQAIATALHLNCKRVLIVCPASVKRQWKREIQKFTDKSCVIIEGSLKQRQQQYTQDVMFYIVNYELVMKDISIINLRTWDMVIADEVSRIKNWKSKTKNSLFKIKTNFKLGLSATPIENRVQELHSIMSWINPNILGTYWNFINEYCYFNTNLYGGYQITGIKDAKKLHETLKSAMIRRKKSDVFIELPKIIYNEYYVPLTTTQKKMYKEIEASVMNLVQRNIYSENCLNQIMYLRELCNSPRLLNPDVEEGSKIPEIISIIEQVIQESKIIIFTQWKKFGDLLCESIQEKQWEHVFVHGGLSSEEKDSILQKFEHDPKIKILVTTDCLSYGCNLQIADVLIHADMLWNPAKMSQRNGRIHRIGQTKTVNIITVLTDHTIEEKVYNLLQSKKELFDKVIEGKDIENLDKEIIRKIFKNK